MSIKRRLSNLECRPLRAPTTSPAMDRALQRKLALPLPELASDDERAECLRLMQAAQRIRDHSGWDAVRDYALKLHTKYLTDPYWGQGD